MAKQYRTKKGNPTATARKKTSALGDGRFPIFDKKSASSALHLISRAKTKAEKQKILRRAARFDPVKAKRVRENYKKRGLI